MIKPCVIAVLLAFANLAQAQPGVTPPYATYGSPQPPPQLQLTADEMDTLSIGYISDGQHIGGGLASLFFGFGVGQAVQGRWHDTGWIFTLGEPVAFGVVMYGLLESLHCDFGTTTCNQHDAGGTAIVIGALALAGLRVWEVVDAFVSPPRHNQRFRALQERMGVTQPLYGAPFIAPTSGGGAIAGITLHF